MRNVHYSSYDIRKATAIPLTEEQWSQLISHLPEFQSWNSWSIRSLAPSSLRPLCTSVTRSRLEVGKSILSAYGSSGLTPYVPVALDYGTAKQYLLPPVILRSSVEADFVILDGMHRITCVRDAGFATLVVLEIDMPGLTLPGTPLTWSDVELVDRQPKAAEKFLNFNPTGFRNPFTQCLNGPWMWRETKDRRQKT